MIDALYWNQKITVSVSEPVKRVDGSTIQGIVILPRRAAERLKRIGIAVFRETDPVREARNALQDKAIRDLNKKLRDFLFVDLMRASLNPERRQDALRELLTLLIVRLTKIAFLAVKHEVEEFLKREKKSTELKVNEEENVFYRLVRDVTRMRLDDLLAAATAFEDLGLRLR